MGNNRIELLKNGLLLLVVISLAFFAVYYLRIALRHGGSEKFVYSLVLIAALIIGVAHIVLLIFRKSLENKNAKKDKKRKRRLNRIRNVVNYITPFVLLAMLYHFWQEEHVLASIIIVVLLLDRLNDLLRKNK